MKSAPLFAKLDKEAVPPPRQVLRTRAASTLRRHLPGWRIWIEFTRKGLRLSPSIEACGERSLCHGLRFKHEVGGCYPWIQVLLKTSGVLAWAQAGRGHAPAKEAVPLPLYVVANWERAILSGMQRGGFTDTLLFTVFSIPDYGFVSALRFSDAQRVSVHDMCVERGVLRGHCWRTKTLMSGHLRRLGRCSGFLAAAHASRRLPDPRPLRISSLIHFCVGSAAQLSRLAEFRPLLLLTSLKATPLSWAVQLEIHRDARPIWGHHRPRRGHGGQVQSRRCHPGPACATNHFDLCQTKVAAVGPSRSWRSPTCCRAATRCKAVGATRDSARLASLPCGSTCT